MENVLIRTSELPSWVDYKYFRGTDLASISDLISIIDDINDELELVKEQFEDFKKDVEDNYRPLSIAEQVD